MLLERDIPFYGHEIDDYWDDVGSLQELRQANFDALTGEVRVELEGAEIEGGLWLGESSVLAGQVLMEPPVFIGEGCEIGAGVRLTGPVVLSDGCKVGTGATLREVVGWPGAEIPPHTVLIGAITGESPLAEPLLQNRRRPVSRSTELP